MNLENCLKEVDPDHIPDAVFPIYHVENLEMKVQRQQIEKKAKDLVSDLKIDLGILRKKA